MTNSDVLPRPGQVFVISGKGDYRGKNAVYIGPGSAANLYAARIDCGNGKQVLVELKEVSLLGGNPNGTPRRPRRPCSSEPGEACSCFEQNSAFKHTRYIVLGGRHKNFVGTALRDKRAGTVLVKLECADKPEGVRTINLKEIEADEAPEEEAVENRGEQNNADELVPSDKKGEEEEVGTIGVFDVLELVGDVSIAVSVKVLDTFFNISGVKSLR